MIPPTSPGIAAAFNAYPARAREKLFVLRSVIFRVAAETEGVGELEETLKWGMPSYLTSETKSGSTVRLGLVKGEPGKVAIYFVCHTTLVTSFAQMYDGRLTFEANRAIILDVGEDLPEAALSHCIALALTYHLKNKIPA